MRDIFITFSHRTGLYTITLRESQEIKDTRTTNNYHDISGIVSNWIHNGY